MKKVTDPDVIKAGERDLIESIKNDLDWNVIKDVFLQKIKSASFDINQSALSFDVSGGEIVVHKGNIAFRLDLELKTEMPILFDKNGNYITDDQSENITNDVEILDDISSLEDEDILGDVDEQETQELVDPLTDMNHFNELDENDDIEDILKESRDFWGKEEK